MVCGADALAAPDEIQVYTEEMNVPGAFGLEQHLNYVIAGTQTPDYPGQMPSHHLMQATPELSYGVTERLEAGLYLPVAVAPDGNSYINGLRVRLKYLARRQSGEKLFYGLNLELGRASLRTSESATGIELRPIIGYRGEQWLMSFNPILNAGFADNVNPRPQFEPAVKLTHRVNEAAHAGLEYYGEYGPLNNLLPESRRAYTVYVVLDGEIHGLETNFGIGHGSANAADAWIMKAIFTLPLA